MAELIIHSEKIKENISYLNDYLVANDIKWSLVTKLFSGDETFVKNIFTKDIREMITSIGDSRLSSLRKLSVCFPNAERLYIKPPALAYVDEIVMCSDISLNTSLSTIIALNASAKKNNLIHKVILMVELGDMREGVNSDNILELYQNTLNLSHIKTIGIGTNLGCLCGVEPTYDRLIQLSNIKESISKKFNRDLAIISGGTSITLPLIENYSLPKAINHFRIGEAAFLGVIPEHNIQFKNLHTDAFSFSANIIEIEEKNVTPDCSINATNTNITKSYRAILDFGLLDADRNDINTLDDITFVGATSDMSVIDVGNNKTATGEQIYKVGDSIKFKPNYMGLSRLLNSKFIDKVYIES